jgi:hypothetical protein
MGAYVKAKTSDNVMELLPATAGIAYRSLPELGNVFLAYADWEARYRQFIERAGDLPVTRLVGVPEPWCLRCVEKTVEECHRKQVAEFLVKTNGWSVEHL